MVLNYNETVGNALKQYLAKIGIYSNNDHGIIFIYDGIKVKPSNNRTVGEFFKDNSIIIVLNTTGSVGAWIYVKSI